jgi:hypothetical protein
MAYFAATVSTGSLWISSMIARLPRLLIKPFGSRFAMSRKSRSSRVAYGIAGYRRLNIVVLPERLGPMIKQLLSEGISSHRSNILSI